MDAKMTRIAILHYAAPPVIGGVETTIYHHAQELSRLGHTVHVLAGSGANVIPNVETIIEPRFSSTHPDVLAVKTALDAGQVVQGFSSLKQQILAALQKMLAGFDVCIAHNIVTFNKNLALTAALEALAGAGHIRLVAWCHDIAWTNPQYQAELHDGLPWDLLRKPWSGVTYVTVSEDRRAELGQLLNLGLDAINVVPPGVALAAFNRWPKAMEDLAAQLGLADADAILLLPARITRRKNIEFALKILAEIRLISGKDFRLIVTGPPGPHNPSNPGYLGELLTLQKSLGLAKVAHFLYALGTVEAPFIPDDAVMGCLYHMADALLFPSTQEGFGIPILEAGLAGIPIFCTDLPPLRASAGDHAHYFDPDHTPPEHIARSLLQTLQNSPTYHLRMKVRRQFRWEAIIRDQVIPLLEVL
jgi:mannosylglucosylglycerate synthase